MDNDQHPLLSCEPLRTALYRNRTTARALRHNIDRACLPVVMLRAVATWLAPWEVISPEAALREVKSLEIKCASPPKKATRYDSDYNSDHYDSDEGDENSSEGRVDKEGQDDDDDDGNQDGQSTSSSAVTSLDVQLTAIADALELSVKRQLECGRKVTSLALHAALTHDDAVGFVAIRRIIMCLPALRSLALPNAPALASEFHCVPPPRGDRDTVSKDLVDRAPKLTALDARVISRSPYTSHTQLEDALMRSLLTSRQSLKTIAANGTTLISVIAYEFHDKVKGSPRLLSDRPAANDSTSPSVVQELVPGSGQESGHGSDEGGDVPMSSLPFFTPAWTLESVTLECLWTSLDLEVLWCFVRACPALRQFSVSHPPDQEVTEPWRRETQPLSADSAIDPDEWIRYNHLPVEAHDAVLKIAAAIGEKHPALTKLSEAHRGVLETMVATAAYPKALLFVFARGFDLTTLRRVSLTGGAKMADNVVMEAAAAAGHVLRKWNQASLWKRKASNAGA